MINGKKIKQIIKVFIIAALFNTLLITGSCNTTGPGDDKGDNTADTTSHNYTWQTWKFGEHSSSIIYDVAVINENNIWAVGEIYLNDSTGEADPEPYAVAHWDGAEWKLSKVQYHDFNQTNKYPGPLFSISFIDNEICATSYANLLKWNSDKWEEKAFFMENIPFYKQIQKIWGVNNSIYCIGRNGAIFHYITADWQEIESSTDLDIYDIFGKEKSNGEYEILCAAAKHTINTDKKIMRIENNTVKDISTEGIRSSISGLWFIPGEKYYTVGVGIYSKENINSDKPWELQEGITQYYLYSIDGQPLNDIAACGSYGELLHFNGSGWKSYKNEVGLNAGAYFRVKIKNDMIIAVGYDSPKAVITIGKR
jgi:hypothetical protein